MSCRYSIEQYKLQKPFGNKGHGLYSVRKAGLKCLNVLDILLRLESLNYKFFVIDTYLAVLEIFGNVCAQYTILFITCAVAVVIFKTKPLNIIS